MALVLSVVVDRLVVPVLCSCRGFVTVLLPPVVVDLLAAVPVPFCVTEVAARSFDPVPVDLCIVVLLVPVASLPRVDLEADPDA